MGRYLFSIIADRIRRMGEGNVFTGVCPFAGLGSFPREGVTPSTFHNTSTGLMSFLGGTLSPSHNNSTGPMSLLGVHQDGYSPGHDWMGVPPGQDKLWTGYTEVGMPLTFHAGELSC